jgi:hypothetical protein
MLFAQKRPLKLLALHWRPLTLYSGLFAILATALYWRLGSLLPGYSQEELSTYQASLDIGTLLDNPLNAPFLLLVRGLLYLNPDSLLMTRIAATLFGIVLLGLFCWLLRQWHDNKTAVIGTLLFGLSAWFLHTARMGTPEILMSGVLVLTACGFWLKQRGSWLALLACFVVATLYLYVPGMVWFIIAGILWQWKTVDQAFKKHLLAVSLGGLVLLAAMVPLGWAIYKDMDLLFTWLGLPATFPNIVDVLKNIAAVPYHLIVANSSQPTLWLGRAPVLDVFSAGMFVMGTYLYLRTIRLLRTPLFITILVLGIILIGLGGPVSLSVIMPFVYLVAAAGIGYLLSQWLTVFPRNPIAKSLGILLIASVVGLVGVYHFYHYFIGWPEAQATHDVYNVQKP